MSVVGDYHLDHIYPQSRFTPAKFKAAGVPEEQRESFRTRRDLLPNLRILEGTENESKRDRLPVAWLEESIPNDEHRKTYMAEHLLEGVTNDVRGFGPFYDERRKQLLEPLSRILKDGLDAPIHL